MVPIFGGRMWTTLTTWSLMIPAVGIGFAVQNPATPYWVFLLLALLCGFGGGNFASSMSNISFFFPRAEKGNALALNAGLGNLGVSVVQFLVPLVITAGVFGALGGDPQVATQGDKTVSLWLQNAGFIWVPFIAAAAIAAWFGMNDIASAKASFSEQAVIFQRRHNWIMCWLYTGTFGSFIGLLGGLPAADQDRIPGGQRPATGLPRSAGRRAVALTDRLGGGQIWRRARHLLGLRGDDGRRRRCALRAEHAVRFPIFFASFLALFCATGIGNASTFQMIPAIMTQGAAAADARRRRREPPAAGREGGGGHHRLHLGDRRLRRLLHPEELRHLDRADRRRAGGALVLPHLLRQLLVITWRVYTRKGGLLHDLERQRRADLLNRLRPSNRGPSPCRTFLDRLTFFRKPSAIFPRVTAS
jgi:NNP family nitrate/nitrite transporter-like MFS transporter